MTVNMRSTNETVHTFALVARALDMIPHQDNMNGFIIVFNKDDKDPVNDEAAFYGNESDFIDFVLDKLMTKAQSVAIERALNGDDIKLHGIKLYPLRRWTVNASAVYQLVAGVMYNASSLVPAGVNSRFDEIITCEEQLVREGKPWTVGDLERAWLDKMKSEI